MDKEQFYKLRDEFERECLETLEQKGRAYGRPDDRHFNFEQAAQMLGLPFEVIWAVYFYKHISAIFNWCNGQDKTAGGEDIHGRLKDARVYIDLLETWQRGKEEGGKPPAPGSFTVTPPNIQVNTRVTGAL